MVERPDSTPEEPQHLCLDKGDTGKPVDRQARKRGYTPHVPCKSNQIPKPKHRGKPRRWKVERTHSWLNRARRLLIRWEKRSPMGCACNASRIAWLLFMPSFFHFAICELCRLRWMMDGALFRGEAAIVKERSLHHLRALFELFAMARRHRYSPKHLSLTRGTIADGRIEGLTSGRPSSGV